MLLRGVRVGSDTRGTLEDVQDVWPEVCTGSWPRIHNPPGALEPAAQLGGPNSGASDCIVLGVLFLKSELLLLTSI